MEKKEVKTILEVLTPTQWIKGQWGYFSLFKVHCQCVFNLYCWGKHAGNKKKFE